MDKTKGGCVEFGEGGGDCWGGRGGQKAENCTWTIKLKRNEKIKIVKKQQIHMLKKKKKQ